MAESKVLEIAIRLKDLTKEALSSINKNIKNIDKSVKELKGNSSAYNNTSFKKVETEVKSLAGAFIKVEKEVKDFSTITKDKDIFGIAQFHKLEQELAQMQVAYKQLKASGTASTKELIIAQTKLNAKTRELKQSTSLWTNEINKVKLGALSLVGVLYSFNRVFQSFSGFSKQMGEVNTLVNLTAQQYSALSNQILNLSTTIPQTASELTSAEYDILSAGASLGSSVKVLELAGKAAIAGVTDTKTAVNVGMGVVNAYGESISALSDNYDILFATVKEGVTTFPELAQSIGVVLPIARNAEVDFRTVGAAIATMTKAGIKTPRATTALRGALMAMSSPVPEAKKRFEELGITWKGLLPTLEAINKALSTGKLSKEGLRFLIPDVEARVGVLALVQNLKEFKKVLSSMDNVAGSTEKAYQVMRKTPVNQIKLFTNEITKLKIQLGGMLSLGLIPIVKFLSSFFKGVENSDVVTKTFIGTLSTAGVVFALWKIGLGSIVTGLMSSIASITASQAALGGLSAQFAETSALMAGGLVISVVYTGYELGKLILNMWALHDAIIANREAAQQYAQTAEQYKQFSDIRIRSQEELLSMSDQEKRAYKENLSAAMMYYSHLRAQAEVMSTDAMLGGLLPFQSAKGKENEKKAKDLDNIVNKYMRALKQVSSTTSFDNVTNAIGASDDAIKSFKTHLIQTYKEATQKAEQYAQKVIALEEKIKQLRMSTADKLRELSRKTMTDVQAWNDRRLQAEQKLASAKQALQEKDFKLAERLAKQAENLYAGLAQKVTTKQGKEDVVVKSLKTTVEVAKEGVKTVGSFLEEVYKQQKEKDAKIRDSLKAIANEAKKSLDELVKDRVTNVKVTIPNLSEMQNRLNELAKPVTKVIHLKYISSGQKKMAVGGILPGYGGGDRIPVLAEAGEGIIRKEAVKKYPGLVELANSLQLSWNNPVTSFASSVLSGVNRQILSVSDNIQRFADGGVVQDQVTTSEETLILRFQAGDKEAPVKITDTDSRIAIKEMAKEMEKMNLVFVS